MSSASSVGPPQAEPPRSSAGRSRSGERAGVEGGRGGPPCDIQFQNPCRYPEAGARQLRPWLTAVVEDLAPGVLSFAVRFVSDREMRRLNATFRQRDQTTDVLSFPGDAAGQSDASLHDGGVLSSLQEGVALPSLREEVHLGDVVISVPASRRQASRLGHSVEVELRVLLLHGVLHCLGYDHETDGGVMDKLEQRLRQRYILPSASSGGIVDA